MPKVVTQSCLEQDWNPRPTDRKPKCLTVAPPRHLIHRAAIKIEMLGKNGLDIKSPEKNETNVSLEAACVGEF